MRPPLRDTGTEQPRQAAPGTVLLELAGISKSFGGVHALRDVSLTIRAGEVHALLGENGAGKSTLMGITVGETRRDTGTIAIDGVQIDALTPELARSHGIGIVHQNPTLIPALTVLENLLLSVPASYRGDGDPAHWARSVLDNVNCRVPLKARAADLGISERQQIELAKAFALKPRILILDEPTAALTADMVGMLFGKIREMIGAGVGIVYISHRMEEIREVAQRVTILRDGTFQKGAPLADLTDAEILKYIVGRETEAVYPPKAAGDAPAAGGGLEVRDLDGEDFEGVSFEVPRGRIVGLAGITGNGQAAVLRALAGLVPASGGVTLNGREVTLGGPSAASRQGIRFMSADRPNEGLILRMSIRENAAIQSLSRFVRGGLVRDGAERDAVGGMTRSLSVKAPNIDAAVSSLSGGNQQKVVLARALLSEPELILAEEPTAGVDIGARADIYHILREAADAGTTVLVLSSDTAELEGLCDRVYVFSRGHVVARLDGDEVTQVNIGKEIIQAPTTFRKAQRGQAGTAAASVAARLRDILSGDLAPALVLSVIIALLSAYVFAGNARFLSGFNVERILLFSAALALIAYGQLFVVMTGGLDLSVGPLVGISVVIGSFFLGDLSAGPTVAAGIALIFLAAIAVGVVNGTLVQKLKFTPVAATLGIYTILQGFSVLLRPQPGGPIDGAFTAAMQLKLLGIPLAFLLVVVLAVGLELALRGTRWGMSLRAVGSDIEAARKIGVETDRAVIGAYVLCSVFTAAGALLVAAQLGIGDANQGVEYTLTSVAAVVLGGASLFGGRGSFVAVLAGAVLLIVIERSMAFLGLSGAWQYWLLGGLVLTAVTLYSRVRS